MSSQREREARALQFLNERWNPTYLKDFIESGELVARAQKPDPAQVLTEVGVWVEVALEEIEEKKRILIDPINRDEADLIEAVDEAFDRMVSVNAAITAHLNSLRRVQEALLRKERERAAKVARNFYPHSGAMNATQLSERDWWTSRIANAILRGGEESE